MSEKTISDRVIHGSTLSQRKPFANAGAGTAPGAREEPLAKLVSDDGSAKPYRIMLGRIDRQDQHAPLAEGGPFGSVSAFRAQMYSYAAGLQTTPLIPPRRSNPVWGLNYPANEADLTPVPFVEISWGMQGVFPQRMIAHWPMQGGSIVVTGSYVEVWAGVALLNAGGEPEFTIPVSPDEWPIFQAQITPENALAPRDAAELSLTQRVTVLPFVAADPPTPAQWGAAVYVPDFARRVKVILTEQPNCEGEEILPGIDIPIVPMTGDPFANIVFLDDAGTVIDAAAQGTDGDPISDAPPGWHAVPAGATMLGVYGKEGVCGPGIGCDELSVTVSITSIEDAGTPGAPMVLVIAGELTPIDMGGAGGVVENGVLAFWNATLTWQVDGVFAPAPRLIVEVAETTNLPNGTIVVMDGMSPSGLQNGTFVPAANPNTVGVFVNNRVLLQTFGDLEAAINAQSLLAQVTTPDPVPATVIREGEPTFGFGDFAGGLDPVPPQPSTLSTNLADCVLEIVIEQNINAVDPVPRITWGELLAEIEGHGFTVTGGGDPGIAIQSPPSEAEAAWTFEGSTTCVAGLLTITTTEIVNTGGAEPPPTFTGALPEDTEATLEAQCELSKTYTGLVHWRIAP